MQKTYHNNIGNLKSKKSFKELSKQYKEKPKKGFTFNQMDPKTYQLWKNKLSLQFKREQFIKTTLGITILLAGIICLVIVMT